MKAGAADVLVARLASGEVVAFSPRCPHQGTTLEDATEWDGNLRCPRHLYLYDPRTGENVLPARETRPEALWKLKPGYLSVHRVEERDGWVWVADEPEPPPAAYDPRLEQRPAGLPAPAAADSATEVAGPVEHPVQTVEAAVGKPFDVVLPTSVRPGHFWQVELDGPLAVVSQGMDSGASPGYRAVLVASGAGEATMRWSYGRPWDREPAEVRTFVVRVSSAR